MNAKLFLTISAVISFLYGLAFLLITKGMSELFGIAPEAHITLSLRFFAAALMTLGIVRWFAKDFRDWDAVRGILISVVAGDILIGLVNIWGAIRGLINALAWSSTILLIVLIIGALTCLMNRPPSEA
ncbi:MAG TPA: hypothetical protein VKS78_16005 [Roseiarcus sp.]|nr:hypothetical protein [Roseiarcus sp.]